MVRFLGFDVPLLQVWSYINFVSLNYGYAGFIFDPKLIKILEGVLFYFVLILLSPKKLENRRTCLFPCSFFFNHSSYCILFLI